MSEQQSWRNFHCFACLSAPPYGIEVRFDKRGHPYLVCSSCGLRCFVRAKSFGGIAVTDRYLRACIERMASDEIFSRDVEAQGRALLRAIALRTQGATETEERTQGAAAPLLEVGT